MATSNRSVAPYTHTQPWSAHYAPLPPLYKARRSSDEVDGRSPSTPEALTTPSREVGAAVLRYRKTPIVLFILYFILLIVPWILTCVLVERPFTTSKYHDQRGRLSPNNWLFSSSLVAFIRVLRSLSSIITVPITTTILAYTAVTFAQNRYPGQKLSVAQLLALSDRGWTDVTVLWHSRSAGRSSSLLWLGAGLVLLGVVQQAIQAAFAGTEFISVVSCVDIPYGPCRTQAHTVGYDTDPWAMALVDHRVITEDVANSLETLNGAEDQHNLWVDNPHSYGENQLIQWNDPTQLTKLYLYGYRDDEEGKKLSPGAGYFVSSLPNGTTTGVLREHAMRLNSTVSCQNISRSDFPETCPGERPLKVRVQRPGMNVSICAPGDLGKHPWTMSRNRQVTNEEIFIDLQATRNSEMQTTWHQNYTMHCKASTSRGYFELGNAMNDWVYGPLLEEWPDEETIKNETNDYIDYGKRPTESDDARDDDYGLPLGQRAMDPWAIGPLPVSGPLIMAANALFGNVSFFRTLQENATISSPIETLESICTSRVPFFQLVGMTSVARFARDACWRRGLQHDEGSEQPRDAADKRLHYFLSTWMAYFMEPDGASDLLEMSMFLVNRAVMLKTVAGAGSLYARPIFTSPGTLSMKPSMNLATIIAISILILLQSVGLAAAVWYSRRVPTWTATFDSMAVARIGRAMREDEIPPLGPVSVEDRKRLMEVNALVGILGDAEQEGEPNGHDRLPGDGDLTSGDREHSSSEVVHEKIQLGLGGPGRIEKRHAFKKKKEKKNKETEDSGDTLP